MEDQEPESTDASSIKPVSSLRSHFENMNLKKPPSPAPTTPKPTTPIPSHVASERGRSSLDIPRRPSPWNASNEGQNNRLPLPAKPLERLQPQNTEGGFLGRQRPVSMGPWSPPRTPPAVTLQSPVSPPKPIFPSNPAPLRQKLDLAQNIAPSSSNPPKVPPPRSPRPVSRKRNQDPPEFSLEKDEKANLKLVTAGVKKPPPINRAAKPATPTTAVAWTPLDPVIPAPTQEASPFSTPPSSDGDLDHEGRKLSQAPGAARIPASASSRGYFPPPSHPAVENARRSVLANLDSSKRLAPNQLAARTTPDISDRPERRPHLPDRRNIEPSPSELNRALTTRPESRTSERRTPSLPPPRPSEASKMPPRSITDFLPPPKRNMISGTSPATSSTNRTAQLATTPAMARTSSDYGSTPFSAPPQVRRVDTNDFDGFSSDSSTIATAEFPDASRTNRRPPQSKCGVHHIYTQYDTRLFDLCGSHVCTGGYVTRAWDTNNGRMTLDLGSEEREIKVTAMTFKPGATADGEGLFLWLGNNVGEISELDLESQMIVLTKSNAHSRREILKMYRYQNSIWSLDEDGKLHVWPPDKTGVPSLSLIPQSFRVSKGHTFSLVVKDKLWLAAGKDIRVYNPMGGESHFFVTTQALRQENAGEISSGAVISNQLNKVYFGHTCGKVSIYSTTDYSCLGLLNVSAYKISTLAGAGPYLWAGFSTGMIYVYDTRSNPWVVKKDWLAHQNPVAGLLVDRSSVWKFGHLQVASIGLDNTIRFWDGMLEDDWIENNMEEHDVEFCDFREIKTVVATWNAGASTPGDLRHDQKDGNFFREVIQADDPPDILVFGFQELVDLEDKKLTAKSFFKGSKKKDATSEHEHMSRQYRAWRDFLVQLLESNMPTNEPYTLLHTANMVGLFSCIFIKTSQRKNVRSLSVAEVKRGLGGLHGNKGAIILRFILDDSSLCFTNCHLAAGQSQTVNRNNDIAAILESALLPPEPDLDARMNTFIGGGDGSMVLDHEICILNGDLNYRIDTMSKDTVIRAIKAGNLEKLLDRDQLLVSRRRNPGMRLRTFTEQKITFQPTYKYDVGTDRYDTSEKNRSPAWCDRVLYRGVGRIKQVQYRRHELKVSDHRPVSGTFLMRVKSVDAKRRDKVYRESENRLMGYKKALARDAKLDYLVSVLGVEMNEAKRLIDK